jgi:hypothetical protein
VGEGDKKKLENVSVNSKALGDFAFQETEKLLGFLSNID